MRLIHIEMDQNCAVEKNHLYPENPKRINRLYREIPAILLVGKPGTFINTIASYKRLAKGAVCATSTSGRVYCTREFRDQLPPTYRDLRFLGQPKRPSQHGRCEA